MPVITAEDAPTFDAGGATITGLASPSRGATDTAAWRVRFAPGQASPTHSLDREEVFVVLEGALTALAERLGVTKQAAIKVVDEMEARGFLVREPHPTDRRAKRLTLTRQGLAVRKAALAESHRMEAELRAALGDADVEAFRRVLEEFGVGERARPVW